jgi:hypothetical protein
MLNDYDDFKKVIDSLVPITDDLIEHLVKDGFEKDDLEQLRNDGFLYSPLRQSFVMPLE